MPRFSRSSRTSVGLSWFVFLKSDRRIARPDRISRRGARDCRLSARRRLDEAHRSHTALWCELPRSFPPGVCKRTLPRCRRILPRLDLPGLDLPGPCFLRGPPSSLTPLWYLHSTVRFEGFVWPPFLCASMWCTWHLSAGTLQSGHGQTRFSDIASVRSLSDANRAS